MVQGISRTPEENPTNIFMLSNLQEVNIVDFEEHGGLTQEELSQVCLFNALSCVSVYCGIIISVFMCMFV